MPEISNHAKFWVRVGIDPRRHVRTTDLEALSLSELTEVNVEAHELIVALDAQLDRARFMAEHGAKPNAKWLESLSIRRQHAASLRARTKAMLEEEPEEPEEPGTERPHREQRTHYHGCIGKHLPSPASADDLTDLTTCELTLLAENEEQRLASMAIQIERAKGEREAGLGVDTDWLRSLVTAQTYAKQMLGVCRDLLKQRTPAVYDRRRYDEWPTSRLEGFLAKNREELEEITTRLREDAEAYGLDEEAREALTKTRGEDGAERHLDWRKAMRKKAGEYLPGNITRLEAILSERPDEPERTEQEQLDYDLWYAEVVEQCGEAVARKIAAAVDEMQGYE